MKFLIVQLPTFSHHLKYSSQDPVHSFIYGSLKRISAAQTLKNNGMDMAGSGRGPI
jgi:hypothetical protein